MNIILLMRYGNVMGLEYLKAFSERGIVLGGVVFEGDKINENDRRILRERVGDYEPPLLSANICPEKTYTVAQHSSDKCVLLLSGLNADLFVLGGTGIIGKQVLSIPRLGTLNCHPGILPGYRGCSCVEWAIYNDDPVGASCHFVTEKVDSGPIVHKETMPVYRNDTYPDVRRRMIGFQARIMADGLRKVIEQPDMKMEYPKRGTYHKTMPADKLVAVKEKLLNKTYRFMQPDNAVND